jgi:hypothetical protein
VSNQRESGDSPPILKQFMFTPSGGWRTEAAALIEEIGLLAKWLRPQSPAPNADELVDAIQTQLQSARGYLLRRFGGGSTSILGYMHGALVNLLRLAPLSFVRGHIPSVVMQAERVLEDSDLRMVRLEALARKAESDELTEDDRETIVAAMSGAYEETRREQWRLLSFRNVVFTAAAFLVVLVGVTGVISLLRPTLLPLCFAPEQSGSTVVVICPASQSEPFVPVGGRAQPGVPTRDIDSVVQETVATVDVLFVEFIGILGAGLAAAVAVRNIRGSPDPYYIPVALSVLKLPTGALTALLGIVLIRAGLIPGIRTFGTSAEIIAWALIFGYSQQIFTGVIDRQARAVLEQSYASRRRAPNFRTQD